MKTFSDFAQEDQPLDGDKERIDNILNTAVLITGYRIKNSKYSKNESGKYLTLQFNIENKTKIIFTGSDVLIGQLERYASEIPFMATLKKINRYYTLT